MIQDRPPVTLSDEERRRVERVEELAETGPAGVDALAAQLGDPSWAVRRWVVTTLARLGDAAVAPLCALLRDRRDDETRLAAAADALVASTGAPEEPLLELTHAEDPMIVADAAQILGRRRTAGAVPELVRLIAHPHDNVSMAAIEALGRIGGRAAVDALIDAVQSRRFFRTFPAVDVLGRSGDPRAIAPLGALLGDDVYALEAARALGRTGDKHAARPLARLLVHPSDTLVRVAAVALADLFDRHAERFGPGSAVAEALRGAVPVEPAIRRLAQTLGGAEVGEKIAICRVLGALGADAAAPVLAPLLDSPSSVADAAAEALKALRREPDALVMAALRRSDSSRRRVLLPLLISRSNVAIDDVVACLDDPDPVVRAMAADALARIGNAAAVPALFARLEESHPAVAQALVSALQTVPSDATRPLALAAARASSPQVRRAAVRILGYFGFTAGIDVLLEAARDPDERIRVTAIQGLPFLSDARAVDALLAAARDPSARTRAAATRALGYAGSNLRATSLLLRALTDADPWVRYYACQSLGRIRVEEAAELLVSLLGDEAVQVRIAAVEALSRLQSPTAVDALMGAARSGQPDVARAAILGLGIAQQRESLPLLLQAVRSSDTATRLVALSAIAGYHDPAVLPALAQAAVDEDESVRNAAVSFLAGIPTEEATVALARLVRVSPSLERILAALSLPTEGRIAGIVSALLSADDELAPLLTSALARMGRPEATAALIGTLELPNPAARKAAVTTLGGLGTASSLAALRRAADADPDFEVRRVAALALS